MVKNHFTISCAADFSSVKIKLNHIIDYLKHEISDLSDDDLFDLRIIYNELITNAIIHGNKLDLTKKVELAIEIHSCIITSVVRDEGPGFDYASLLQPEEISELSADDILDEHGRGLQLVLSLVDFVNWNETGNEIVFQKKLHVA